MPNWCYTTIAFYSENKAVVEDFRTKLLEVYDGEPTQKNDFGNGWLGDYINKFIPECNEDIATPENEVRYRGSIHDFDRDTLRQKDKYFYFFIWTETAWVAMTAMWSRIIKKLGLDIGIAFSAEETGNEYLVKYDEIGIFEGENVYCDFYFPKKEYYAEEHYHSSVEDCAETLAEYTDERFKGKKTIEELQAVFDELCKEDEDGFGYVVEVYTPETVDET